MFKTIFTLFLVLATQLASAGTLMKSMRAEDQRRLCPAAEESVETRTLRREAAAILQAADLPANSITVLIGECEGFASAAVTLDTIVIHPSLARLPRNERWFLLAHEIGHLVNKDVEKWAALSESFDATPGITDAQVVQAMNETSKTSELRADEWAGNILRKLGFNPATAAASFFERQGLMKLPGTTSHPAAKDRVQLLAVAKG